MSEQIASPPAGGQGATEVTPPANAGATPPENVSPPPAPPPPPDPFWKSLKNPELRGYAEVKGFKGSDGVEFSETILESYRNLEKLRGVPAERLLTLPEDLNDAAAMAPIREKLGLAPPADASEYGFATVEGVNPERAKVLEGLALKHGVPKAMAAGFFAELSTIEKAQIEAEEAQYNEVVAVERGKLRAEIGEHKWDAFLEEAKRAGRRFGLSEDDMNTLETNIGYSKTMRFLNMVGAAMGEAAFVDAGKRDAGFAMTPDAAKVKIAELGSNVEWRKRYLSGDKAAIAEMQRLQQIAHPGMVQS